MTNYVIACAGGCGTAIPVAEPDEGYDQLCDGCANEMTKITSEDYQAWLDHPLTKALKQSFEQSITDKENQPSQYGTVTLEMYEAIESELAAVNAEREAALARLSEERDIWDRMFGDGADKLAHMERELDDCLYVLESLWDKQCNKIVTQKWAEILIRNKRGIGASSAEDSYPPSPE